MGSEVEACAECSQNCLLIHRKKRDPSQIVSSFFKVMYGKHFSEVLIVPPRFARTLTSLVGKKTYLEDSRGQKWNVVLSSVNGSLAFRKGWHEFSSDHGIEMGDFVVFNYIMGSHFVVQIYSTSGCERLTLSGRERYQNKRCKITTDSIPRNGPYDSFYNESPTKEDQNSSDVSLPEIDGIEIQDDASNVNNVPSQANMIERPKVAPTTDFLEERCIMINRDTNFDRKDDRDYLFDLSAFEMCDKKVDANKTSKLQLQVNGCSQASGMLHKTKTAPASVNVKKCHIKEGDTVALSKHLLRKELTPLPSSCPRIDMPSSSNMPQKPVGIPHTSEFPTAPDNRQPPGGRTLVKHEPRELNQISSGNGLADTSCSGLSHNANLFIGKEVKINNGNLAEISNYVVKGEGKIEVIVKPEPSDFCDSSTQLGVKITCSVQPDSESFLELPEPLPIKAFKQRANFEQKLVFLRDPDRRRLWPVVYHRRKGIKVLTSGWNSFRKANHIQTGDQCAFVVENVDEGILGVQILRS